MDVEEFASIVSDLADSYDGQGEHLIADVLSRVINDVTVNSISAREIVEGS